MTELLKELCDEAASLGYGLVAIQGRKVLASGDELKIERECIRIRNIIEQRIEEKTLRRYKEFFVDDANWLGNRKR